MPRLVYRITPTGHPLQGWLTAVAPATDLGRCHAPACEVSALDQRPIADLAAKLKHQSAVRAIEACRMRLEDRQARGVT